MNGKPTMYLDQYGYQWFAKSAKELHSQIGKGRISPMFRDKGDGTSVKVGYVIGKRWCVAYQPVEIPHRRTAQR